MAKSKSKQVSFAAEEPAAQPSDNLYRGYVRKKQHMHGSQLCNTSDGHFLHATQLAACSLRSCRFLPDATLREISIQPKLDCSSEALGEDKELWLIQLPLQVRQFGPALGRALWVCVNPTVAVRHIPLLGD